MGNHATRNNTGTTSTKTDNIKSQQNQNSLSHATGTEKETSNSHTQFIPIDHLSKILAQLSRQEGHTHGISREIFAQYLFPNYQELAARLFVYLSLHQKTNSTDCISIQNFKQQTEKFLAVMNDVTILENYVKMYSKIEEEADINPQSLKDLLNHAYQIVMDNSHNTECLFRDKVIDSVVVSCFHGKESLSVSFVSNWIWQYCPRILYGLHCYVIHVLTTAYRNGKSLMSEQQPLLNLRIPTPILDQTDSPDQSQSVLPLSYVWLLSSTLPLCYLQISDESNKDITHGLVKKTVENICPRHWTLLYDNAEHGTGANRFLHHVLGYKGPTLLFIRVFNAPNQSECAIYCICSAVEWHESHLYWGDEDSMCIELLPSYKVIEKGAKILYLNTGIRGYPQGLRVGSNPREPYISIDESFQSISIAKAPHPIAGLEVWGCGDRKLREKQLDIKKWQVKEAEKQRVVKLSTSDWLDHPDRYLLELAGRASYNESNK